MKREIKRACIFLGFLFFPLASYGQSDPDGYAVICNDTCTITLPDERGDATQVTVGQGYVLDRIDLTPGQSITVPPNESVVADPDNAMPLGSLNVSIPQDATNTAAPAVTVGPLPVQPATP